MIRSSIPLLAAALTMSPPMQLDPTDRPHVRRAAPMGITRAERDRRKAKKRTAAASRRANRRKP